MSVFAGEYSVITRLNALRYNLRGGVGEYRRICPGHNVCWDEFIARAGFPTLAMAKAFAEKLWRRGLTGVRGGGAMDFVIADQDLGLLSPCGWLGLSAGWINEEKEPAPERTRITMAHYRGSGISLTLGRDWRTAPASEYPGSETQVRGTIIRLSRSGDLDTYLDLDTGETVTLDRRSLYAGTGVPAWPGPPIGQAMLELDRFNQRCDYRVLRGGVKGWRGQERAVVPAPLGTATEEEFRVDLAIAARRVLGGDIDATQFSIWTVQDKHRYITNAAYHLAPGTGLPAFVIAQWIYAEMCDIPRTHSPSGQAPAPLPTRNRCKQRGSEQVRAASAALSGIAHTKLIAKRTRFGHACHADLFIIGRRGSKPLPLVVFIGGAIGAKAYQERRSTKADTLAEHFQRGCQTAGIRRAGLVVVPCPPCLRERSATRFSDLHHLVCRQLLPQVSLEPSDIRVLMGNSSGAYLALGMLPMTAGVSGLVTIAGVSLLRALEESPRQSWPQVVACWANRGDSAVFDTRDFVTWAGWHGITAKLVERDGGHRFADYEANGSVVEAFGLAAALISKNNRGSKSAGSTS